jgi:hypothetical protein
VITGLEFSTGSLFGRRCGRSRVRHYHRLRAAGSMRSAAAVIARAIRSRYDEDEVLRTTQSKITHS